MPIVISICQMGNFTNVVDEVVEDKPVFPSLAELEREEVCLRHQHLPMFKFRK